jgi:hypothetical protein
MNKPIVIVSTFAVVIVLLLVIEGLVHPMSDAREVLATLGLLILGGVIYFIPAIVAHRTEHHNAPAIIVLNLFAGWTVIGWIAALVWAYTRPAPR